MTSANRVQLAFVRESTPGTTPNTPRMRLGRMTGESLFYRPLYNQSEELRSDRMLDDPTQIMFESGGGINMELSYPVDNTWLSDVLMSLFYNTWSNTNYRDNDGTADSVITDVATTNTVLTCTTGTAFVAKELVQFSGFGVTLNNGVFKCTTGSATVPRFVGSGITDEAAPPAAARVKVVGFIGDSGDINATSTGLSSTTTDFTTFTWLVPGKWIKIDSTTVGMGFLATANNSYARVTAVTATTLTLDNRPSGWTTETGTALTIKVYCGDQIKNGTTQTALTIERGFLGQITPTYIKNMGMTAGQGTISFENRQKLKLTVTFTGMGGGEGTSPLDASPDAATTAAVMSAHVNVGRVSEGGAAVASPNYLRTFTVAINNNLRTIEDLSEDSPVGINEGENATTGNAEFYFGSRAALTKFYAGTVTSLSGIVSKNNQALIVTQPRVTLSGGGTPQATGKNTDVMVSFETTSSKDTTTTNAHVTFDRMEYVA